MLRRVRWGNVGRLAGVLVLVALVAAWPRLAAPAPVVPEGDAEPVVVAPPADRGPGPQPQPRRRVAKPLARDDRETVARPEPSPRRRPARRLEPPQPPPAAPAPPPRAVPPTPPQPPPAPPAPPQPAPPAPAPTLDPAEAEFGFEH